MTMNGTGTELKGKIVVACDSFKGSLDAVAVCQAVEEGLRKAPGDDIEVIIAPMADGGEGTARTLTAAIGGKMVRTATTDATGRPIEAEYGLLGDGRAVIELAAASGLPLISARERNPELTSTFGTGLLIRHAIESGCHEILLCIGGSATNDAAMGLLDALGTEFTDKRGNKLSPCGKNLGKIHSVRVSDMLRGVLVTVACDVTNPFYGPNGAACVFAPQKGAEAAMVKRLDLGMKNFANLMRDICGMDVQQIAGSGAAGGAGGTLAALAGARLIPGAMMVAEAIGLEKALQGASLAITGEGCIDSQTLRGKAPMAVLELATKCGVSTIAIAGRVTDRQALTDAGFAKLIEVTPRDADLSEAMKPATTRRNIINSLAQLFL